MSQMLRQRRNEKETSTKYETNIGNEDEKQVSTEPTILILTEDETTKQKRHKLFNILNNYATPLILTIVSFGLRYYELGANDTVIWDEAHFAKFGSFYNKHEFYHDVHPPLGKMLCGLSEWLVGYDVNKHSDYMFESGSKYPEGLNIFGMRLFQIVFSSMLTPIAWLTCRSLNMNLLTSYLISLMICLESSFIVLGKFVLLDSFLFFFTSTTILCLSQVHKYRRKENESNISNFWFILLGLNIGCVCSIKWVGLFVTAVVGIYTILDLWIKFWDERISWNAYLKQWIRRIISLIIIPACLYMIFFKIHLDLLYLLGDGSGSMNTLFQANMLQTDIAPQPRFVQLDDEITMRSQGMDSNLLHSHRQVYPDGSRQHQITTYGYKDSNNVWRITNPRSGPKLNDYLKDGDIVKFVHVQTGSNLHSHTIPGHVSKNCWEVSGYGDSTIGDEKDDWIVEIVEQLHSSNETYAELYENDETFTKYVHPVSTTFRLKHKVLNCYLGTTGKSYPTWGFQQGEVVCLLAPPADSWKSYFNTIANWNIESVEKTSLEPDTEYEYPKSNFFKDFIQLQRSMAASNNALVPDPAKHDSIASAWWEWPLMWSGIRMSGWGPNVRKYFMFGNPFIIWFTTLSLPLYVYSLVSILFKWRHQDLIIDEYSFWQIFMISIIPFLGYVFHYLPFIVMGRVTYFHHYMPALYFAIFMCGFSIDYITSGWNKYYRRTVYFTLYIVIISFFILFSPTCLGMTGLPLEYSYLNWLPSWEFSAYRSPRANLKHLKRLAKKNWGKLVSALPFIG